MPKWMDIKNVTGKEVLEKCGAVDLVSGGFPCQDISVANTKGKGIDGERSGLWGEYFRLLGEIRPRYALVENSSNLLSRGLGKVLGDLAEIGYDTEWHCIPASYIGANHVRDRVWIVAYARSDGGWPNATRHRLSSKPEKLQQENRKTRSDNNSTICSDVANAERLGWKSWAYESCGNGNWRTHGESYYGGEAFDRYRKHWASEPDVGRVAYGVPNRVHRLKCLGNGQVIPCVQWIGEKIMEFVNG